MCARKGIKFANDDSGYLVHVPRVYFLYEDWREFLARRLGILGSSCKLWLLGLWLDLWKSLGLCSPPVGHIRPASFPKTVNGDCRYKREKRNTDSYNYFEIGADRSLLTR